MSAAGQRAGGAPPLPPRGAWRATLLIAIGAVAAGFAGAAHFTAGFRAFTSEDARRLRVAESAPPLPALDAVSATASAIALWGGSPAPIRLVTFMYTRCPTLCRAAGQEFVELQRALRDEGADDVRLLSLSFDPAHDTPERLRDYAARHRADPAYWTVASPRSAEALAALLRVAGVVVIDDGLGGFAHNAAIHLVAPDGRLLRIFDLADHRAALAYARALAASE
jgi:protein SCO1/2